MRYRVSFKTGLAVLLYGAALLAGGEESMASISLGGPLRVRILYDNSGSMYPGYRPPGAQGRKTKSELGARFFYEYPEAQRWLADFVASQTILDAGTIGMWTFTSFGSFASGDIQQVHSEVPIRQFDVARAVRGFPSTAGQTTYLTETLDQFTRGFEGLVWLITDNIVETRTGQPDGDVRRFFESLRDAQKYRSVQLFKYPFRDERTGSSSALAIYGILVSESSVPVSVLAYYDRKFRSSFRFANLRQGDPPAQLFPGREHRKLKDLTIDALELQAVPSLEVVIDGPEKDLFREGQKVQLALAGDIQSHLTQHSVTDGRYRLEIAGGPSGGFQPEPWARTQLGAEELPAEIFPYFDDTIREPIPPNGTRSVAATIRSLRPISFASKGFRAWIHLAMNGAVVKYTGRVKMTFSDVRVRLEREQMAGLFGVDQASSIFNSQDFTMLKVDPSYGEVSFVLKAGSSRTALLLLLSGLFAALLGVLMALLARRQWYTIRITGAQESRISLRRLGSHQITQEGQTLGRLSRRLSGDYDFAPNTNSAAFTILPTRQPDSWDVRFRDGQECQLSIEPKGGSRRKLQTPPVDFGDHPGPPGSTPGGPLASGPRPARSLPTIDPP